MIARGTLTPHLLPQVGGGVYVPHGTGVVVLRGGWVGWVLISISMLSAGVLSSNPAPQDHVREQKPQLKKYSKFDLFASAVFQKCQQLSHYVVCKNPCACLCACVCVNDVYIATAGQPRRHDEALQPVQAYHPGLWGHPPGPQHGAGSAGQGF